MGLLQPTRTPEPRNNGVKMNALKKLSFFLKIILFRKNALMLLKALRVESFLDNQTRASLAFDRMKKIIIHAYESTDFYREKYDQAGINVYELRDFNDLKRIPLLTKSELRTAESSIKSRRVDDRYFIKSVTGGSSGVPTTVYHDKRNHLEAFNWFLLGSWGAHPYDNAAFLERYNPSQSKPFLNLLTWWPTRRAHLDVTSVNKKDLLDFYAKCKKIKPKYIEGYVGAVEQFATFLNENNLKIEGIKFVWTTSAPLLPKTRGIIGKAFNCPVYDQYGCCEVYWLGAECPLHDGLHVFDTFRHIEILDDDGAEAPIDTFGKIVITDLLNYAFPLIRYANDDRGAWKAACKCGSSKFKNMHQVQGRTSECIKLPSGGFIPGEFLTTLFDGFPSAASQFQLRQKKDLSVDILYTKGSDIDSDIQLARAKVYIVETLQGKSGLSVRFIEVDVIPHDKGKLKYVISELDG